MCLFHHKRFPQMLTEVICMTADTLRFEERVLFNYNTPQHPIWELARLTRVPEQMVM